MLPVPTFTTFNTFGSTSTRIAPTSPTYDNGFQPGVEYPCENQNYFLNVISVNGNVNNPQVISISQEIVNFLSSHSVTPNGGDSTQLGTTINGLPGTTSGTWQLNWNSSGPIIRNNSGTVEIRNSGNSAYANFQALGIVGTSISGTAITGTSFNGMTITTTTGTFTLSNGKTLTVSDSTTIGTSSVTLGNGKIMTISDSTTFSTNSITMGGGEILSMVSGKNVTFSGALTFSGSFDATMILTGATNVTFPTSGTLETTANTSSRRLSAIASNWYSRTGAKNEPTTSICWSPTLALFCGVTTSLSSATTKMQLSADGIKWNLSTGASSVFQYQSVFWSASNGGQFIALGGDGSTAQIETSPDGVIWTSRINPVGAASILDDGVYGASAGINVAVSHTGNTTTSVITSPTGATWTSKTTPESGYYCVEWSPDLSLFVILGASIGATSPDGITWTVRTVISQTWRSVVWASSLSLFVAMSTVNTYMTSPDGINWTSRNITGGLSPIVGVNSLCWSPDLSAFVVAISGNLMSYSIDGINWITRGTGFTVTGVVWSPSLNLFATGGGISLMGTSFSE